MFTGIIQTIGEVISSRKVSGDIRLVVTAKGFHDEVIALGDSIACNGVCLTVVEFERNHGDLSLVFDVSRESLSLSLIESWKAGSKINMELAMLPTSRFGGHIVSGHVDGVGEITQIESDARSWRIWFKPPVELRKYIAAKGSITIDGISLTINGVDDGLFHINVVPHTMEVTTMGLRKTGDQVHLEVDLIARYLDNLLNSENSSESGSSEIMDALKNNGYLTS